MTRTIRRDGTRITLRDHDVFDPDDESTWPDPLTVVPEALERWARPDRMGERQFAGYVVRWREPHDETVVRADGTEYAQRAVVEARAAADTLYALRAGRFLPLVDGHRGAQVGEVFGAVDDGVGLVAIADVEESTRGDELLLEIAAGRLGLSIGQSELRRMRTPGADGVRRWDVLDLDHVALTPTPANESCRPVYVQLPGYLAEESRRLEAAEALRDPEARRVLDDLARRVENRKVLGQYAQTRHVKDAVREFEKRGDDLKAAIRRALSLAAEWHGYGARRRPAGLTDLWAEARKDVERHHGWLVRRAGREAAGLVMRNAGFDEADVRAALRV